MKVRILRTALEDLAAGRRFYNRQEQGVGDFFFDSIFSEIDSLILYYGIHSRRFAFHRLLTKRFPFAIYYRVIGDEVVVFRVLDCRRSPNRIRHSLTE